MNTDLIMASFKSFGRRGLGAPILIITMLAMMILPLPSFILDILFTFNIGLALMVLLATVYCSKPLDFEVFPTILLVATLLRLSLNIASTRIVLLNGHTGTDAAGQVVKSFGEVVVGGNYTVGLVVFAILVVINFVVVTKGAGRVSEVSARFTLDAMPGKQMAIDADLNSGLINQMEAKARRKEVAQEADFYGSMDGASKFVRGDAIAGILILFINILGGLIIGTTQHHMSFGDAGHNYILLTIGDGLVAQVPALLLSIGAAIIVTRVSSEADMSHEVSKQVISNPKALAITAGIMFILGVIPGMPHFAFLGLSSIAAIAAYYIYERQLIVAAQMAAQKNIAKKTEKPKEEASKELNWDDVQGVDTLGLQVGYRLIPMVDKANNGELLARIKGVRKKLSQELGFLIPAIHIRDNLDLNPNTYRLNVAGVTRGEVDIYPDKLMAINPGKVFGELEGIKGKDPAFELEAVWIDKETKEHAQSMGYTVVDASTVIATHISQVIQKNASQLIGYEEVQEMLDKLAKTSPKLVESLVPDILPLALIVKVVQRLLADQIPVSDFRTIATTLAETGLITKDPDSLIAAVRVALKSLIVQEIVGGDPEMSVITIQPELEQLLQNSLTAMGETETGIEPGIAEKMQKSLTEITEKIEMMGQAAILLVQPGLRLFFSRFSKQLLPNLHVLSYQEIPDEKQVKIVGTVG